jgi:chemotaxis protein MotD
MLTPGLPTSASATGAKSTTALSSRSQNNESESFGTVFSRADRYDTRSVADELEFMAKNAQPDDADEETGEERIDLRDTSARRTPKQTAATSSVEFRNRQQALTGRQSIEAPSVGLESKTPSATDTSTIDQDASTALSMDEDAPQASLARRNLAKGEQPSETQTAARSSSATNFDKTPAAQPAVTSASGEESDWTLAAKPAVIRQVPAVTTDEAMPAQPVAAGASGQESDWTLPAKVDPEILKQAMAEAAAAQPSTVDAPVKGRAMPTAAGAKAEATVRDDALPAAAETSDAGSASGAIDAVLTLLGGNGVRDVEAARSGAGTGRLAAETSNDPGAPAKAKDLADRAALTDTLDMPDDETTVGGNERTFRFSSTREGQASLTMTIGTGADGTARFDTARASATGAEGVVVLDSRRFLGFNQSANGASLTSAMVQDPEWASAMQPGASLSNAAAQSSTGKVVNTLKLQMTPIELGMVTATLRLSGEELTVHLTVETKAAHAQLTEDSSGIIDALKSQGFAVDQLTVSITPAAQQDANQPPAADLGPRGQAGDRQFDGNAGRGLERGSDQSGGRETSGRQTNEPATDLEPAVAAGGTRPQQLYI